MNNNGSGNNVFGLSALITGNMSQYGLKQESAPELWAAEFPDDRPKRDGRRAMPGVVLDGGAARETQIDRVIVGYTKIWREAAAVLSAIGFHSDNAVTAVQTAPDELTASFAFDDTPPSLGFILQWGATWNNSANFNLKIGTKNWVNYDGGVRTFNTPRTFVDRSLSMFTCSMPAGGRIFVPWARFQTPSMVIGMPSIALPNYQDAPGGGLISISGIPAGMIAGVGLQVILMTADSIALRDYFRLTGAVTGVPTQFEKACGIVNISR